MVIEEKYGNSKGKMMGLPKESKVIHYRKKALKQKESKVTKGVKWSFVIIQTVYSEQLPNNHISFYTTSFRASQPF